MGEVSKRWVPPRVDTGTVRTVGDVAGLWRRLRSRGVSVCVCTSDDRESTLKAFRLLELEPDGMVCGDDPLSSKPSPEPIWHLCHKMGVSPQAAAMVGDTQADMHAGVNSKCGAVIGVLSGGGDLETLSTTADAVLESVHQIEEELVLVERCLPRTVGEP